MFASLLGAPLIGTLLKGLLGPLLQTYLTAQQQKLDAAGSTEARKVELAKTAFDLEKREAELQTQIILAEQGNWFARLPRPLMGVSVSFLVAKLLIWDLALGQWTGGRTDMLSDQAFWIVTTIIGAYFITRSAEKITKTITGVFGKKE